MGSPDSHDSSEMRGKLCEHVSNGVTEFSVAVMVTDCRSHANRQGA